MLPMENVMKKLNAGDILEEAAKTFKERNKVYGNNYELVGAMTQACFPNGVVLKTERDHRRFHILSLLLVKLSRYVRNWESGGHQDSIHDAIVYCSILETIDATPEEVKI